MPASARPGSTMASDSVAYALWLFGQSPRVTDNEATNAIMRRYPELTLGEALRVQSHANDRLAAGAILIGLDPGQPIGESDVPDSGGGDGGYRTQVDVIIPSRGGGSTQRTVIIEDTEPPTSDKVTEAISDAIWELCNEYDGLSREKCLEWMLGDITIMNAAVSRGH